MGAYSDGDGAEAAMAKIASDLAGPCVMLSGAQATHLMQVLHGAVELLGRLQRIKHPYSVAQSIRDTSAAVTGAWATLDKEIARQRAVPKDPASADPAAVGRDQISVLAGPLAVAGWRR